MYIQDFLGVHSGSYAFIEILKGLGLPLFLLSPVLIRKNEGISRLLKGLNFNYIFIVER